MYGTSQSAPVVAGTIALWLEADAELTPDDVNLIIEQSSTRDEFVEQGNSDKWGYGKLNALKGLQIIEGSGIDNVAEASKLWSLSYSGGVFTLLSPCDGNVQLELYDVSGCMVFSASGVVDGGVANIRCSDEPAKGVYVARVTVDGLIYTFKIII